MGLKSRVITIYSQVRQWAEHHAREVEALERRPHGALVFAKAVIEGSRHVLGSAAQLMSVHSAELAAAEEMVEAEASTAVARTRGVPEHLKPWKRDGLDALGMTLGKSCLVQGWTVIGASGR